MKRSEPVAAAQRVGKAKRRGTIRRSDRAAAVSATELLARIRIVLVRPRGAANVGSVARAMKNMGLRELVLVRPRFRSMQAAGRMAVHADDLLQRARRTETLLEAISDCGLVVGTTCRGGQYRAGADTPAERAGGILERAHHGPVAIVFGPEDHGLSNDDLKLCQQVITIDTSEEYASLNLAQAVLVLGYELRRCATAGVSGKSEIEGAPAADIELMFEKLRTALVQIGFLHVSNPDHIMFAFRRILGRTSLEARDVRILFGMARQIEWFSRNAGKNHPLRGAPRVEDAV